MADEPSNAELARRMDRIERLLQDLTLRLVSADVYTCPPVAGPDGHMIGKAIRCGEGRCG